jgi:hypothetical protein
MASEFEKTVKNRMEELGWTVYNSGWPDFLCVKGDELRVIEVKSSSDSFRGNQTKVLQALAKVIKVQTAHPGPGFGDIANTDKFCLLDVKSEMEPEEALMRFS